MYLADHLGTSRAVWNLSGQDESDFYPFGGERVISSGVGNRYKFTGKERDLESGLDNFGARYVSSSLGRFTSIDPKPITNKTLVNPQDLNSYAYVVNNPLSNIDPDGKDWRKALSDVVNAVHVKFSGGLGAATKEEAMGFGRKASAQVKSTLDVSLSQGVKLSASAEAGAAGKVLGAEVGPQVSKPLGATTMDPQGHVTGEVGGPAEGSLVKLPSGTSSSSNGKTSELTIAGFEENIVVPVDGIPVPTPLTVGVSISIESEGLLNAIVDLFQPAQKPSIPTKGRSSPARVLPSVWRSRTLRSAWTGVVGRSTTFSSSDYGAR